MRTRSGQSYEPLSCYKCKNITHIQNLIIYVVNVA